VVSTQGATTPGIGDGARCGLLVAGDVGVTIGVVGMGVGAGVEGRVGSAVGAVEKVGGAVAASVASDGARVEAGGDGTVGATVGVEPTAHEYSSPTAATVKLTRRMTSR
jgi:hypothetical protein